MIDPPDDATRQISAMLPITDHLRRHPKATSLTYAIKFIEDMDKAVRFHVDDLELSLRFQSPEWREFETGSTTLALHIASTGNPAGTFQLGFVVEDIQGFYSQAVSKGVRFTSAPVSLHGQRIAKLQDVDGAVCSISGA